MVPAAVAVAITAEVPCFQISDLHQTYARMCAVLRVLPTSICRYVTLNALRPRHLSRPLACVCAGELPCGCFELNRSTLHCYSANAALPWHDSSFFYFACLWPSLCCHANTGMVVWSLPIWQLWARLFSGQRQKEAEMEILKRRLDLVLHSVSSGRKKVKCNLYTENWPLSSGRLFYSNYDIETTLVWVCRRSE